MAKSKIPGFRHASGKEVRELLKLAWVRDEELSDRKTDARLLPDGRVLLYLGDGEKAALYPSRESLAEMQREGAEEMAKFKEQQARGLLDPSLELLPPIDDFLRDVEAHAKSLGPRLRIPDAVLDGTIESLDAVDKALKRIPWAKRQVPDLVTPLVAYLGEVARRASGGRWSKYPTTDKKQVPVFDPVELAAWREAQAVGQRAFTAAQQRTRGGATPAVFEEARKAVEATGVPRPKPIRFDVIEEPIRGHENEPMVTASGGWFFQPFASVFIPMIEPSKRIPLRSTLNIARRPP
jgi:hypothetical protein